MSWPLSQDYNEAIQDAQASFSDPELRGGEATTNALGMPMPRSGNFADVYEFNCPAVNTKWAVKCFTRHVPGLRERYSEISRALQAKRLPFTVDFQYLEQGLRIRGQWYPILKMHWIEGLLLNEFVRDNIDKPALLGQLGLIWCRMAKRLRDADIAHCDLQHGNVLLVPGSKNASLAVKLIDYDGMFVPALAQTKTGEVGHPNYQHPQRLREGVYNAEVDRFPLLVVATALQALSVGGRSLWERYDNGDNLLFKESDLRTPEQSALSPLFKELLGISDPQTRTLVGALLRACRGKLEETPTLADLVPDQRSEPAAAPTSTAAKKADTSDKGTVATKNEWDFASTGPPNTGSRPGSRGSMRKWIWMAGGIAALALASVVIFLMLGGTKPKAPGGPYVAQKSPQGRDTAKDSDTIGAKKPALDSIKPPENESKADKENPPKDSLESLPPEERERILKAIERGLAYMRKNQGANGVWPGGYPIGLAALPGLTLLECGVPPSDPQIQKAAAYVRSAIARFDRTYELSLAILFLDRLGDPMDEALIQSLALRLIGGQTSAGGWYYTCPVYSPDDERKLLAALNALRPRSNDDLFVPGPDGKKPDWFPQGMDLPISPSAPVDVKKLVASLPANLQKVPALDIPVPGKPFPTSDLSDNSNTQFAALGLWAAGRHGVPNERALALLTTRFRQSQAADGGWNYHNQKTGGSTSAMTGAGLLGLAVGHGLVANHTPVNGAENRADRRAVVDTALDKGLASIARHIGQPITEPGKRPAAGPLNLYFLWTLERVAVLYNLPLIDGKDWYRWGAQQLVETQNAEGFWTIPNGYPGASPVLDTSLGLLFLKRANFAQDLTRKIEYLKRRRPDPVVKTHDLNGHTGAVESVAFSPDGKRIVSAGWGDNMVKVWDADTGTVMFSLKGHTNGVTSVAFSPDGKRIVSGSTDKTVKVWDANTGVETLSLKGHTHVVHSVAFSPDGKRIASGGNYLDRNMERAAVTGEVKVWDADKGTEILSFRASTGEVNSVAFSPDGKRIVSASREMGGKGEVKVWDADKGVETLFLKGHALVVRSVAFSSDGKRIASASADNTVKVWDADTGVENLSLKGHTKDVYTVAFSPDSKRIASGSLDNTVKVWDANTGVEILSLKGHTNVVSSVAFSPDGKRIASASHDQTVKVWDVESPLPSPVPVGKMHELKGHTALVFSVSISADGKRIVSGSQDKTVKVWDADKGTETFSLKGHTSEVQSVAVSADGKRIASGSVDKTVKVWDADKGTEIFSLMGHTDRVWSVAISADGKRIVSGSSDKTVKVWDADKGTEFFSLKGHKNGVISVAISADGKRIVSASPDTMIVWDADKGTEVLSLMGPTQDVRSVAISADGKRIVSGSGDKTVKVWDADKGTEILTLKGHTNVVSSVALSADGKRIVSGSYDNTLKVWDVDKGTEILTFKGHTYRVHSVSCSPDGKRIVSGSWDNTVKVWDADM
jgi:WD40 repeat protein